MSTIDPATRLAIYEAHNRRCFYCDQPFRLPEMEIDHVIPQSVTGERLEELLAALLLPGNWDVQGLQNFVPACRRATARNETSSLVPNT